MSLMDEWPHPERCPSSDCRGQFYWIKHYGMICTIVLNRLGKTDISRLIKAEELSKQAQIDKMEGLGLA
jgi:hypothetical protein